METDYVTSLLSAVLALGITLGLSYLIVRFSPARNWLTRFSGRTRLLEIEDVLRVDAKSTLMVVRVEGRRLLLATHSGASATLITELQSASGAEARGSVREQDSGREQNTASALDALSANSTLGRKTRAQEDGAP